MTTNLPAVNEKFPIGLAYDVAMNASSVTDYALFDDEDLCALYDITTEQLFMIQIDPDFRIAVRSAMYELKQSGDTVRTKMRMQFESYIDTVIPALMISEDTPPKDKLEILKMLGKGGGVLDDGKPKTSAETSAPSSTDGPKFTLVLQTATPVEPRTITIEQEK